MNHNWKIFSTVILITLLFSIQVNGEEGFIEFEDAVFKEELINAGADINGDGEIDYNEALLVTKIKIIDKGIKSIAGIEYFINVDRIYMNGNDISDVSMLSKLTKIKYMNMNDNNISDITAFKSLPLKEFSLLGNPTEVIIGALNPTVDASEWAVPEVVLGKAYGLITDSVDGDLTENITREQFCTLVINMSEVLMNEVIEIDSEKSFSDTDNEYVLKASSWGVVNGYGDGEFKPNEKISREQLAAMVYRAAVKIEAETEFEFLDKTDVEAIYFNDMNSISSWALLELRTLNKNGIINGVGNNTIAPKAEVSKEVAIILIKRLFESYLEKKVLTANNYDLDDLGQYAGTKEELIHQLELDLYKGDAGGTSIKVNSDMVVDKEVYFEAERNFIRKTGWVTDNILEVLNVYPDNTVSTYMVTSMVINHYGMRTDDERILTDYETDEGKEIYPILQGTKFKALNFINTFIEEDMSDSEKVKVIYDYIYENVEYTSATLGGATSREYSLFNQAANDTGYAMMFKYLCILSGLKCKLVQSDITSAETYGMGSAMAVFSRAYYWNAVEIDGKELYVDITMDKSDGKLDYELYLMDEEDVKGTYSQERYQAFYIEDTVRVVWKN